MSGTIRVGTSGSPLANAQTGTVVDALRRAGIRVEVVTISIPNDRSAAPIAEFGVGAFTSALRDALAEGAVDVVVHSYKDLPTAPDPRIAIAAVPERADPRDVLVARDGLTLGELPAGSVVGTGSARRTAQLHALGFGLQIVPIRGHVDTRISKVANGEFDAVVLARAGLARLGRLDVVSEVLDPIQMLPAPAQGALAIECRADDVAVEHLLQSTVDDEATRAAVTAERAMLAALEAGCSAPVGALAEVVEDLESNDMAGPDRVVHRLSLRGVAAARIPHGSDGGYAMELLRASAVGDLTAGEQLGHALADELLELGAGVLAGPEA